MAVERILISGVTEILKKLVPVVAQEIGSAWGVKNEFKKLQTTLEMILAVISDAERKQVRDEAVRLWLRRLKDMAYDVDDVMDDFSYETIQRGDDNLKHKVLDSVSSLAYRFKLVRKIKEINKKLDEITKDVDRFQLKIIPSNTGTVAQGESSERQTTSFASEAQIVGREDDKDKLIKILTTVVTTSSSENVAVVSIVGMGGLGKTTLAQLIYNDDSVEQHFEPKIWVCVSDEFDVCKLLSDIMESITGGKFNDSSNFNLLVRKVREQLTGKRYLLVLDDLWNEDAEQWERLLQSALIVGAQGSRILTTTRKRQVADVVKGSIPPYFLETLQVDECWSIMQRKAFSPGGALKTPDMINIGKEIANKCSGLPLAAKFLGGLMHSKNNESDWLSIIENDMWNTPESKITRILRLSYDNLSPHLQRCFSYCSIFPKDWELSKQTLIQLWMAEGFLEPSDMGNNSSFEDIGDGYFESLIRSSFFEGVVKDRLDDVMTFKVHDLVHDVALATIGDHECFTVKVTDQLENKSQVRRLNLIMDKNFPVSKSISNIKKLRTLMVLQPNYYLNLGRFSSNKHLRILHLGKLAEDFSEIKFVTSKFRQLRYFHLSSLVLDAYDDISVSRLYNMQTLVLSNCGHVQNLVKGVGSLNQLRHLDISFSDIEQLPDSVTSLHNLQSLDLHHCKNFTSFPDCVSGLACLRYLDMSFTPIEKIPDFVTSLRNLRTLDVRTCKKLKTLPEYVSGLKNLSIFRFQNCPLLETLPKDFGTLTQLRYINLYGTKIGVLPEPCTNLNNLEYVDLFECELPKEVANWVKLRKFYFRNMAGSPMMGIGKLIWLQDLIYRVREKAPDQCNDGIQELANLNSIEKLTLDGLENVKDPTDAERANLKAKQNLRRLDLHWSMEEETEEDVDREETDKLLGMEWYQNSCNFQVFEALRPPNSLVNLGIKNFMGWEFPSWMYSLHNLHRLVLRNCRGIKQLPGPLPRLKYLTLKGMPLKSLDISGFPCLIELDLTNMFVLEELCCTSPNRLQGLVISYCKSLTEIPWFPCLTRLFLDKIHHRLLCLVGRSHTSLTKLYLENIEELVYFPVSILENNCNLQILNIRMCNQFKGFRVDDDENDLTSVSCQRLFLVDCPILKFLPDLRGWITLRNVTIFNCPKVKESLTYDLKSLSFLRFLFVDFIQRSEQRGDPSVVQECVNLMDEC